MITIDDVIVMKKERNIPYGTQYRWLIEIIENDLRTKSNGDEWVLDLLADYEKAAKLFIVHQFRYIGKTKLANELFTILDLDPEDAELDDKYLNELVDSTLQ